MAFDASKPVTASFLSSAEMRANFAAIQASLGGRNWFADPGHLIWPYETSNGAASQTDPPAHYVLAGTGATLQRCGALLTDTADYLSGGFACELTYGSATATFYQNLLDDAIPDIFEGLSIVYGAAVKCGSSNAARIFLQDSTGITYSDYHTGGGDWEWLTVIRVLGDSTSGVQAGLELGSASAHIQGHTALLGEIPPLYPIPADVNYGTYTLVWAGVPATTEYSSQRINPGRPFLFTGVSMTTAVDPSGGTMVMNLRRYTSSWVDMLASDVSLTDGHHKVSDNTVDTEYRYRCIDSFHGASGTGLADDEIAAYCVTNAGAGESPTFQVRGIQFNRPQDQIAVFNDPATDGGA